MQRSSTRRKDGVLRSLREWRVGALLSVRDLAAAAGITAKTLTDIEYGRRAPGFLTMRAISQALGVDPLEITEFVAAIETRGQHRVRTSPGPDDSTA